MDRNSNSTFGFLLNLDWEMAVGEEHEQLFTASMDDQRHEKNNIRILGASSSEDEISGWNSKND